MPQSDLATKGVPRSFFNNANGATQRDIHPREILDAVRANTGELWVDIDSTNRHQTALLEKIFGFHPLAVEDTLNPRTRVKVEEYDGILFVVVRGVRLNEGTDDPYDLDTFNLYFFLGQNFLVTVHSEHSKSVAAVADTLNRNPELLSRGADRLMHAIMDAAVDEYFPMMDQIDEFIHGLEERVFVSFDGDALHDIFRVKQLVLSLRRHLAPQREVFNVLTNRPSALLAPDVQIYFRDIYDHVLRLTDSLDIYRDLLSSTMEAYLTQVSNRLGMTTKGLTVVATLSVPFVVVSGMWGMNFARIPLAQAPYGFWIMLVLQLGIGAGLLILLKWRRWL
ncbi:MAG: magnesium/cobalt transporter CorA [Gemmatimonadaceae bacterium]